MARELATSMPSSNPPEGDTALKPTQQVLGFWADSGILVPQENMSMSESKPEDRCVNCRASEMEIPIVLARYAGGQFWICSRCLPILIHKPEQLTGALNNADRIPSAPHEH